MNVEDVRKYCIAWDTFPKIGNPESGYFAMSQQCGYPVVPGTDFCEKHTTNK